MSSQSPSANSRGQQGAGLDARKQKPAVDANRGRPGDSERRPEDVPPSTDVDQTEDPSKD